MDITYTNGTMDSNEVAAPDIISGQDTGFTRVPLFMIARDGEILEDYWSITEVYRTNTITHPEAGKFIDSTFTFVQHTQDGTSYPV